VALGVLALLTPLLLLPGLAWGAAGRLRPAWYPASYLAAARAIDASPAPGTVLLLPWVADRTPAWNHGEVMLDAWPRLVSRQVIWNLGRPDDRGAAGGRRPVRGRGRRPAQRAGSAGRARHAGGRPAARRGAPL
jgi:hypothetical protein